MMVREATIVRKKKGRLSLTQSQKHVTINSNCTITRTKHCIHPEAGFEVSTGCSIRRIKLSLFVENEIKERKIQGTRRIARNYNGKISTRTPFHSLVFHKFSPSLNLTPAIIKYIRSSILTLVNIRLHPPKTMAKSLE